MKFLTPRTMVRVKNTTWTDPSRKIRNRGDNSISKSNKKEMEDVKGKSINVTSTNVKNTSVNSTAVKSTGTGTGTGITSINMISNISPKDHGRNLVVENDNNDNHHHPPSMDMSKFYTLTRKQRGALRDLSKSFEMDSQYEHDDDNHHHNHLDKDLLYHQTLLHLKQQSLEQEAILQQTSPLPWYSLLVPPAQALWRSSPKPPPAYIKSASEDTISLSERTTKQLKRTQDRIISHYSIMSDRREQERRNMVNTTKYHHDSSTSTSTSTSTTRNPSSISKTNNVPSTYYKPEYTLSNMKYRLVVNYSIMKRILHETQSLLGPNVWFPKHVLDVGMGIGSASAATLDFFHEQRKRYKSLHPNHHQQQPIEWIHGIEPSQSMRDASSILLKSVMEGHHQQQQQQQPEKEKGENENHASSNKIRFTVESTILPKTKASPSTQSFDLALCSYTLCEIPSVPAALSMAVMIWEKLRPGGVAIFIEPGTPDGFNALRSVRNMLLDCCPPSSNHRKKKGEKEEREEEGLDPSLHDEECHVIAPCTHNGTCPMIRHRKNFHPNRPSDIDADDDDDEDGDDEDEDLLSLDDDGDDDDDLELEDEYDVDENDENDEDDDENFHENDQDMDVDKNHLFNVLPTKDTTSNNSKPHAFETAFCSFVHGMPGKEQGNQGEKFSYLVVQKRTRGESTVENMEMKYNPFHDTSLVELLKESLEHDDVVSSFKQNVVQGRPMDDAKVMTTLDTTNHHHMYLQKAMRMEEEFIDSKLDSLGLELVRGHNRSQWGRIVRAPIKKKGHVIVDYCGSSSTEEEEFDNNDNTQKEEGRIHRLMVTKSQSSKSAPGMYLSSRKARWGGFWPHVMKSTT